jgi:protein MpaA
MKGHLIGLLGVLAVGLAWADEPKSTEKLCEDLRGKIKEWKWTLEPCKNLDWASSALESIQGRPLWLREFGEKDSKNVTLILSMVHPDEVTPFYVGFQTAHWLRQREMEGDLKGVRVIVAPLVNPDGLLRTPPTRTNARGVDLNRNFDTKDWRKSALKAWKVRYRKNPRRFPGLEPGSESETKFQEDLIRTYRPVKILSIHAPLNHLDYDGPTILSIEKFQREYVSECQRLKKKLNAISSGFFPGSLGNFSGQELGIPTITMELPTSDPAKADLYWQKFQRGIRELIYFEFPHVTPSGL